MNRCSSGTGRVPLYRTLHFGDDERRIGVRWGQEPYPNGTTHVARIYIQRASTVRFYSQRQVVRPSPQVPDFACWSLGGWVSLPRLL
jgi:hypothetical protein